MIAREGSVFGSDSESFLQRFNANLAVIGCSGLTPQGPNDVSPAAAGVKRAMLARAESNMLLLDHSKYDVLALENVCSLGCHPADRGRSAARGGAGAGHQARRHRGRGCRRGRAARSPAAGPAVWAQWELNLPPRLKCRNLPALSPEGGTDGGKPQGAAAQQRTTNRRHHGSA